MVFLSMSLTTSTSSPTSTTGTATFQLRSRSSDITKNSPARPKWVLYSAIHKHHAEWALGSQAPTSNHGAHAYVPGHLSYRPAMNTSRGLALSAGALQIRAALLRPLTSGCRCHA